MLIKQAFDERFVSRIRELETKYGNEMFELDGIGPSKLDITKFIDKFLNTSAVSDVSTDANANVEDNSMVSFEVEYGKAMQRLNAYYLIWKAMVDDEKYGIRHANKTLEMLINGALKLHDAHHVNLPYCFAFSLQKMVSSGLPFIKKIKIGPPKHLKSFVNLTIQFVAYASNQIAGAAALPDFFVYFDWFARKDYGENYLDNPETCKIVREELQSFVYSMNYSFRSIQSPFTNISLFDRYFLKETFGHTLYPDLSRPNLDNIMKLQELYMRWFIEESKQQTFTFPVNTVTFYKDDDGIIQDKEFLNIVSELNSYNGTFNIFCGPLSVLSSCCRLRSDTAKIKEYTNSFGAGGPSVGSSRVVAINLPRIAYESESDEDYIKKLEYTTRIAQDILLIHRNHIVNLIKLERLPLYTHEFMDINRQFMTVGFIGMNEACEIRGKKIMSEDGIAFASSVLDKINKLNDDLTKIDGLMRNMEQIPGESAAVMFCKKDQLLFKDNSYKLYANQYIPLWENVDIEDRINIAGKYDSSTGGGSIAHINSSESITPEQMKKIILVAAKKGVIYFAINIAQCRCNSCGKLFIGKFDKSPCHDASVTPYLRVVGFLTPVTTWISERRDEYKQRQFYVYKDFL